MNDSSKRVLITGAASGLGRELANTWSERGWRVAISDVDQDSAEQARQALPQPDRSIALSLNVLSDEDFARAIDTVTREWGGIDVLVNNAGVGSAGTVRMTPMSEWSRVIDVNLLAVARGCKAAMPGFVQQGHGHIVNIASFAGIANAPGMAAYNASKAGVVSLSESLRHEGREHGVGVSVACPAFFRTNLVASMDGQSDDMKNLVHKLMDASGVTAVDVARDIVDAVESNRFLVITHRDMRWLQRLKRFMPETFFRMVHKQSRGLIRE